MRLSLFPKEPAFFDLFNNSADNAVEGAQLYLDMCERFENPAASHKLIREKEHQGDEYTHEIIRHLNTTFVTPFDREDIHELATGLDDIMDFVEAAADIFILHQIERPTPSAVDQARVLVKITQEVAAGVHGLRRFKGLETHWVNINTIENEGDMVYRRAVADLFSGDHKALDVLKLKELYEQAEEAIDACERVANTLEAIVLKQ
jgi:predicted phosphate transport protein (TIGR00153 family)